MKKRWLSLLLVFILVVSLLPMEAKAAMSGTCGDNLTWTLDDNGTLTISGTGKMDDYSRYADGVHAPWRDYRVRIRSIVLNPGITEIGVHSFFNCFLVQSVDIPDSVTHIHDDAFAYCSQLTTVRLSDNLVSLGESVFFNCPIKTLVVPDSLTDVHENAFMGIDCSVKILVGENNPALATDSTGVLYNKSFTRLIHAPADAIGAEYTIPSTVTSIGAEAFRDCDNLWRITIPEGVTQIGIYAFGECDNLLRILLPETLTDIGDSAFTHCPCLVSATVPGSVTTMGKWIFSNCTALESVLLSDGLTQIGICMFQGCTALRNIVIPASIYTIGSCAFGECSNLENVYFGGTQDKWDSIYIGDSNECLTNATIHVIPPDNERPGKEPDRWSFRNHFDAFGPATNGYYISGTDYQRLLSNLSETDQEWVCYRVKDGKKKLRFNVDNTVPLWDRINWNGSCYGMSAWVCLVNHGLLRASDIDGHTQLLADYALTSEMNASKLESAINFLHCQQRLLKFQGFTSRYKQLAQILQMEDLRLLGEQANATGKTFILGYQWYKSFHLNGTCKTSSGSQHTVVGYGWEAIEPVTYTVNGATHTYNYRILIYDCANPDQTGQYHLYYNDQGTWCIPGNNIISTNSQTADTKYNNGILLFATNNPEFIMGINYNRSTQNEESSLAALEISSQNEYVLHWAGGTAEIAGFSVTSDNEDHGISVFLDSSLNTDEDLDSAAATVLIPASEYYTIESSDNAMQYRLHHGSFLINAQIDSPGQITFGSDCTVTFAANESAPYSLNFIVNEGTDTLPWTHLTISGQQGQAISATRAHNSVLLTGDHLKELTICASTRDSEAELKVSSEMDSIQITENSGKLVVCEDTDSDGTYETTIAESLPFTDVSVDAFYHDAVCWAVRNGITTGATATTFNPTGTCLRAQVVTFLHRAAGNPESASTRNPFADVKSPDFFYKPVLWAVEKGITNGTSATAFGSYTNCNRAAVVTFLWRAAASPEPESTENPFDDVKPADFFYKSVLWAVEKGITNGVDATHFGPTADCNRAQVVTFLYRTHQS